MTSVASADVSRLAEALRRTAAQSRTTTMDVLIQSSNQIMAEMLVRVPVDTGRLRGSIGVKVEGDKVIIGPDATVAPYAPYVEFGTQPHDIKPKTAGGVLVFTIGGKKVFTKLVHHPGTRAQPFVIPAFEAWVDSLGTMAAEANVKVLTDHA
jgi:HK97 gp10 family phage protein